MSVTMDPTYASSQTVPSATVDRSGLSADDFWQVLLTQMQMQDPFAGGADTEAMMQQFLSLQSAKGMEEMSSGVERMQALLLLGQQIETVVGGAQQIGNVVGVSLTGKPVLTAQVGERLISVPLEQVSAAMTDQRNASNPGVLA